MLITLLKQYLFGHFLAAGLTLLLEHLLILQKLETIQWQYLVLYLHLVTFITIKWILSWFCLPFLAHSLRHNAMDAYFGHQMPVECTQNETCVDGNERGIRTGLQPEVILEAYPLR